jgi:hypothetical protein
MRNLWHDVTALFGDVSFGWTILFVVCFACLLAFAFEASVEVILSILVLGAFTARAEHALHRRNDP